MIKTISDTVIDYAQSRISQLLTDTVSDISDDQYEMFALMNLSQDLVEKSKRITQAKTFAQSLTRTSELWVEAETIHDCPSEDPRVLDH